MTKTEKEHFVRHKSAEHVPEKNEKIMWSVHAINKLRVEGLRKAEVEELLKECIIIEDYPTQTRPLPDCLVLGFLDRDPVHAVVAIDSDFDRIFVVTVYRPTPERWKDDWEKRKK